MAAMSFHIISRHAELVSASIYQPKAGFYAEKWTLKQVEGDERLFALLRRLPI
jgi:hypothetical protein